MQFKEYIMPLVELSQSSENSIRICEMSLPQTKRESIKLSLCHPQEGNVNSNKMRCAIKHL